MCGLWTVVPSGYSNGIQVTCNSYFTAFPHFALEYQENIFEIFFFFTDSIFHLRFFLVSAIVENPHQCYDINETLFFNIP